MTAVVHGRIPFGPPLPPPPPLAGGGTTSGYARVIVCSSLLPSASVAVTHRASGSPADPRLRPGEFASQSLVSTKRRLSARARYGPRRPLFAQEDHRDPSPDPQARIACGLPPPIRAAIAAAAAALEVQHRVLRSSIDPASREAKESAKTHGDHSDQWSNGRAETRSSARPRSS